MTFQVGTRLDLRQNGMNAAEPEVRRRGECPADLSATVTLQVRLPQRVFRAVEFHAEDWGVTPSRVIRELIRDKWG